MQDQSTPYLTPDEIEKLKSLLPLVDTIREEAEYTAARRIVLRVWKQTVLGIAAFIGAVVMLREQLKAVWHWAVGG